MLLHLVDATQADPGEAYRVIREELAAYDEGLAEKEEIVALNKIDALNDEQIAEAAASLEAACGKKPMLVSGATGKGVPEVTAALFRIIQIDRGELEPEEPAPSEDGWTP